MGNLTTGSDQSVSKGHDLDGQNYDIDGLDPIAEIQRWEQYSPEQFEAYIRERVCGEDLVRWQKPISELHEELLAGESIMLEDAHGELWRFVRVVNLDVIGVDSESEFVLDQRAEPIVIRARYRLVEKQQVLATGMRKRGLPRSLSEKLRPGESAHCCVRRCLDEEIGFRDRNLVCAVSLTGGEATLVAPPKDKDSYPGVQMVITEVHSYLVVLPWDFVQDRFPTFVFAEGNKTVEYGWVEVSADEY